MLTATNVKYSHGLVVKDKVEIIPRQKNPRETYGNLNTVLSQRVSDIIAKV